VRLVVLGPGHPFRGGIARTTTELVTALSERGHRVEFLTPLRQYPTWLYPGGDDRDPDACPELPCSRRCLDPLAPQGWSRCRRLALEADAEVWVLPYWTWVWAPWWAYLLQGDRRPPAVAVVHNPADHERRPLQRLAARVVLSRCHGLFTHARALAEELSDAYPLLPVAAHPLATAILPAGADRRAARSALGLPQDRRVALFLGLIRPYKGVDLLLEAFAALEPTTDWQLVVAGEAWGSLGRALVEQVERLGLGGRVRLDLRWVPEPEVGPLLEAADLLVLPYRSGSQSAVAPLGFRHGVPVLSTTVGGLPEVVEPGHNGVLVPPGSVTALAQALSDLDRGSLDRLAVGARATAARLSWSAYAGALERLLERVVERW
jgi:D-inositol-3-phosphate glycosyltransferase